MLLVDAMDAGPPHDLGGDEPELIWIAKGLLHGAQTVTVADQRVHAASGECAASTEQNRQERAACAGEDPAEG